MNAMNDEGSKVLLDTGPIISVISEAFDKRLRLQRLTSNDKQIHVQGIGILKVVTKSRATVKFTLGWEVV